MSDPVRILIVDDDANLRKTLSDILKAKGFAPFACETGGEALVQVGQAEIIVALIDLRLADISGLEVLRGIRERSPQTECILLTGHASQATAIEAVNLGAYSYFQKPYDIEQLLLSINHAVGKRQAEFALRESEAQYRLLADHMTDTIWLMDMNLRTTYISPSVEKLRGYTLEELQQLSLDQNLAPASFQEAMEVLTVELPRVMADPTYSFQRTMELEFYQKAGGTIWAENKFSIIRDENGLPVSILGEARDITERKQAEEAIRRTERRSRALIEKAPDGIVLVGIEGKFLYASPSARKIFGYDLDETLDADPMTSTHPDDLPPVLSALNNIIQDPTQIPTLIYRFQHRDGSWRWIKSTFSNLLTEPGVEAIVINFRDITERKQAEELVKQQSEQLRLLYEASQRLNRTLDLEEIYQAICDFMSIIAPNDGLVISDYNPETQLITCRAYWMENKWLDVSSFPPIPLEEEGRGTQSIVIRTGQPMLINDFQAQVKTAQNSYFVDSETNDVNQEPPPDEEITRSALIVPLKSGGKISGAIQVLSYRLNAYNENQLKLLEALALHIVSAQQNALLYAQVEAELNERKQAEDALKESEERYRLLFELSPDAIAVYQDGKVAFANQAAVKLMGAVSPEELIGKPIMDFVHPDYRQLVLKRSRQQMSENKIAPVVEEKFLRLDGSVIDVDVIAAPISYRNKLSSMVIIRDITARKLAEEAVQQSEHLFRALFELSPDAVMLIDPHAPNGSWPITDCNIAACLMNGYDREELIGHSIDIVNEFPGVQDERIAYLKKLREGGNIKLEARHRHKNGTLIPIEVATTLIKIGERELVLGIDRDITARKQAEELLQRRVAELEVLYENSLTISQMLDPRQIAQTMAEILSQKLEWHHAAVRLYHLETNKVELLALHRPHTTSEDISDETERLQSTTSGTGLSGWVIQHGEAVYSGDVSADPRYIQTYPDIRSGIYVPMKLGETVLGCISVESEQPAAFDEQDLRLLSTMAAQAAIAIHQAQLYEQVHQYAVDLEKRVEERTADLQRANLELARAARMKDEFLASMSHELRTPLTGILGLSESLQLSTYGDLSEKQLKVLKNIESSGRHLLELINDILDLSKIEAGKFDLQIEPCSLAGMCQASLQMTKGMAQQKRQHTSFSITPDSIVVRADARRLKQMLVNLLSNAVKFTPEDGSLGIEVRGSEREQRVMITVWDTGIGIQPEDLPRLFQPFVQLDSSLSRQYAGTGLGLSLVQRMVGMHGGSVEVESVPGQGSRFTIILPWETEAGQPAILTDKIASRLHKALIIDGNKPNAELLSHYLENLGLKSRIQPTGLGAVELAAQTAPDVILIHLHLLNKPGLELLMELKLDERTRNIPVIIMSVEEKQNEAMALGAAGYLVKPFSLADLQTELQRVAALVSSPEPTAKAAPVVLLADDNEIILEVLTDFLRTRDFQVVAVHSGSELLESVEKIHPDILLIDIQMPGMDGLEVMQKIRAHPDGRISALPMIAVTALAMSGDRERCMAAGANEYLSKPLHLENLVETIWELCKA